MVLVEEGSLDSVRVEVGDGVEDLVAEGSSDMVELADRVMVFSSELDRVRAESVTDDVPVTVDVLVRDFSSDIVTVALFVEVVDRVADSSLLAVVVPLSDEEGEGSSDTVVVTEGDDDEVRVGESELDIVRTELEISSLGVALSVLVAVNVLVAETSLDRESEADLLILLASCDRESVLVSVDDSEALIVGPERDPDHSCVRDDVAESSFDALSLSLHSSDKESEKDNVTVSDGDIDIVSVVVGSRESDFDSDTSLLSVTESESDVLKVSEGVNFLGERVSSMERVPRLGVSVAVFVSDSSSDKRDKLLDRESVDSIVSEPRENVPEPVTVSDRLFSHVSLSDNVILPVKVTESMVMVG